MLALFNNQEYSNPFSIKLQTIHLSDHNTAKISDYICRISAMILSGNKQIKRL